jgi:hypothetical protein
MQSPRYSSTTGTARCQRHRAAPAVRFPLPALISVLLVCPPTGAQAAAGGNAAVPARNEGYEIAARADRSDDGFGSSQVSARMTLRNAAGQESTRRMRFRTLERENESAGDKSLVIFETPRDVQGTALLSHTRILGPDQQWLYLPALKRVKRISSANKSGPFVGSEFAFEDFTSTELNKYEYRYVGEEVLADVVVDVVECVPRYGNSGYSRLLTYYDQQIYQARRIEYFDRKAALLKTLTLSEYQAYDGIWRAHLLTMVNHQTRKETDIAYEAFDFTVDFDDRDFDRAVLTRIR